MILLQLQLCEQPGHRKILEGTRGQETLTALFEKYLAGKTGSEYVSTQHIPMQFKAGDPHWQPHP